LRQRKPSPRARCRLVPPKALSRTLFVRFLVRTPTVLHDDSRVVESEALDFLSFPFFVGVALLMRIVSGAVSVHTPRGFSNPFRFGIEMLTRTRVIFSQLFFLCTSGSVSVAPIPDVMLSCSMMSVPLDPSLRSALLIRESFWSSSFSVGAAWAATVGRSRAFERSLGAGLGGAWSPTFLSKRDAEFSPFPRLFFSLFASSAAHWSSSVRFGDSFSFDALPHLLLTFQQRYPTFLKAVVSTLRAPSSALGAFFVPSHSLDSSPYRSEGWDWNLSGSVSQLESSLSPTIRS